MDEMMIERLSAAEDRIWSGWSLGGMYDPADEIDPFEDEEEEEEEEEYDWKGYMEDLAFDISREG